MWIIRAADSSALDAALDRLDEETSICVWPQEEPARAAAQRMSTPAQAWYAQRLVDLLLEAMQEAAVGHGRCREALRQLGSCLGGHAQPAPPPPAEAPAIAVVVAPEKLN